YASLLLSLLLCSSPHPLLPAAHSLSLHDALPISSTLRRRWERSAPGRARSSRSRRATSHICTRSASSVVRSGRDREDRARPGAEDRKSTRLNSSHRTISYAVFCLKKKKKTETNKC